MSKSLGSRTAQTGYISKGKDNGSQSLQMMERPLMTPDELKSMPKGQFIVMKTGAHPMNAKIGTPAPSARSFSTTLPEF